MNGPGAEAVVAVGSVRVGVLGGGQLGRMLGFAARRLGMVPTFVDPAADACAAAAGEVVHAAYDDHEALAALARAVDVVTYEFENVPVDAVRALSGRVAVHPGAAALETAQDRLAEKTLMRNLAIDTARFEAASTRAELEAAVAAVGMPAVVKTRRLGYDGKGQALVRDHASLDAAWSALGDRPLIVEEFVAFRRELSILAVRSVAGDTAFYPLVENHHREGILRLSRAPAPDTAPALQAEAERIARNLLDHLGYAGVIAVELFEHGHRLLANEIAPRVHNSGHWTIEAAECSQFENHLRAVTGLPLGSTAAVGRSVMVNLIGGVPDVAALLAVPGAHLHLYGKEPRPGRKVGHVTLCDADDARLESRLAQVLSVVGA